MKITDEIVWVVEEQTRHGIEVNVFKYRPDITNYLRKKEKPTEHREWEDLHYGWDAYIDYDKPDGWAYTVGPDEYCWRCWKCRVWDPTASE